MSKTTNLLVALGVVAGLGVAALPLSSYAVTGTETTPDSYDTDNNDDTVDRLGVQVEIKDYISIEAPITDTESGDNFVKIAGVINNGDIQSESTDVNVKTNASAGYTVSITAAGYGDDKTALVAFEADGTTQDAANTDKFEAGAPTVGESKWGYKVSKAESAANVTIESAAADYAGVTTGNVQIVTGTTKTADAGDTFTITFGATASASMNPGVYKGGVKLTAATKTATTD